MSETFAQLTGHRSWWVPGFSVWGEAGAESVELLADEIDGLSRRVQFFGFALGGEEQEVFFSNLVDHRANPLPAILDKPLVVLVPRSQTPVILLGEPSPTSFTIARTQSATDPALVDLWIVEMGS